jgi:hypothetical protein
MRRFSVIVVTLSLLCWANGASAVDRPDVVSWNAVDQQANLEPLVKQSLRFLTAVTKGNFSDAQRLFNMKDDLRDELQRGHSADLMGVMNLRPPYSVSLVGVDVITNDDVSFVYVINTVDGPVAFKMDMYQYQGVQYMAHCDVTNDWDEIVVMIGTVDRLSTPLQVTVNQMDPDGDPQITEQANKQ